MRQSERQLLPGRQVIGRARISSAVDRYPDVVQEVDVLVLFVACKNVLEIRTVFFSPFLLLLPLPPEKAIGAWHDTRKQIPSSKV